MPDRLKQYLSDVARRELSTLRADLDLKLAALEAALARPDQHDSIETLVLELARTATLEAEAATSRAMFDAQHQAQVQSGAADARRDLEAERATVTALREDLDHVRSRLAADVAQARAERDEVVQKLDQALREVEKTRKLADARAKDIETGRAVAGAAQVEATARLKTLESRLKGIEVDLTEAERVRREAVVRAESAEVLAREASARASNLDAWSRDLETRTKGAEARAAAAEQHLAAAEARVREIEARADEAVNARVQEIEARADEALKARDALALSQQASDAAKLRDAEQRLAAADDRIRALELQLFRRADADRDEDLSPLLVAPSTTAVQPTRSATRYGFGGRVNVEVDGQAGVLLDLSKSGAQILSAEPLDEGRAARLALLSDEIPVVCSARIVWTRIEAKSPAHSMRHRAGLLFLEADAAAIEAFIIRYATT